MPEDLNKECVYNYTEKTGADVGENYRTISLLSHASKILIRRIYRRIENRIYAELGDDQYGIR